MTPRLRHQGRPSGVHHVLVDDRREDPPVVPAAPGGADLAQGEIGVRGGRVAEGERSDRTRLGGLEGFGFLAFCAQARLGGLAPLRLCLYRVHGHRLRGYRILGQGICGRGFGRIGRRFRRCRLRGLGDLLGHPDGERGRRLTEGRQETEDQAHAQRGRREQPGSGRPGGGPQGSSGRRCGRPRSSEPMTPHDWQTYPQVLGNPRPTDPGVRR